MQLKKIGPLKLTALMLITSAIVRVPILASEAYAQAQNIEPPQAKIDASNERRSESDEIDFLLAELAQREQLLEVEEAELNSREQKVIELKSALESKLLEVRQAEEKLRAMVSIASSAAEDDIQKLISVYENMKPKDAAKLFEKMQPNFAAGFLSQMKPEISASILAALNADAGYAISVVLAGRNQVR